MNSGSRVQGRRADAPAEEVRELRRLVEDLAEENRALRDQHERNHVEVLRRVEELRDVLAAVAALPTNAPQVPSVDVAPAPPLPHDPQLKAADYARLIIRVRALVRSVVPLDATVVVVSRGDDELLDLDGRSALHFPQTDDGQWIGFHPRNSAAAIAHLDDLRRRGADHFLLPATALWWLDHYVELRLWLERNARLVVRRDDACLIYALPPSGSSS